MSQDMEQGQIRQQLPGKYEGEIHIKNTATPQISRVLRLEAMERLQEELRDARDELIKHRSSFSGAGTSLRGCRHEAGQQGSSLVETLKRIIAGNGPQSPENCMREVDAWRDRLEELEAEYDDAEEQYNIAEWEYTQREKSFVQALAWPNHPPSATPQHKRTTTETKHNFEIPSLIGGNSVRALGDFCAKKNYMSEEKAQRLGLAIDRQSVSSVSIGNGRIVSTKGTVETPFRFENERETYSLVFHIIPSCVQDIILGKAFLKATKTFSSLVNYARRVVRRNIGGGTPRHFLYLGDSAPNFTGLLNGSKQKALADSGSKVLLMDEGYANSIGLSIARGHAHETKLRFADNSSVLTVGMVYGATWQFGQDGPGTVHTLDFHVMKNAPAPVVLSDELLFATNAFAEFDCYLVDEDDDDENAYFFAIDIDTSYHNQGKCSRPPLEARN
jgi:hypothetical protein